MGLFSPRFYSFVLMQKHNFPGKWSCEWKAKGASKRGEKVVFAENGVMNERRRCQDWVSWYSNFEYQIQTSRYSNFEYQIQNSRYSKFEYQTLNFENLKNNK